MSASDPCRASLRVLTHIGNRTRLCSNVATQRSTTSPPFDLLALYSGHDLDYPVVFIPFFLLSLCVKCVPDIQILE